MASQRLLWNTSTFVSPCLRRFTQTTLACNFIQTDCNVFQKQPYCHLVSALCKPARQRPRKNIFMSRSFQTEETKAKNRNSMYYSLAFTIMVGGSTYLSVLLYRIYCQSTGRGGQAVALEEASKRVSSMKKNEDRVITVNFNADVNSTLKWNFKPSQPNIKVSPGETALAFYTARNPTKKAISGIATYNVLPFDAGKHFNKIQCFCFEEQQLNPDEEIDMPVFFYLDPNYAEDPRLETVNDIILSYTFFESKEGLELPRPEYA